MNSRRSSKPASEKHRAAEERRLKLQFKQKISRAKKELEVLERNYKRDLNLFEKENEKWEAAAQDLLTTKPIWTQLKTDPSGRSITRQLDAKIDRLERKKAGLLA